MADFPTWIVSEEQVNYKQNGMEAKLPHDAHPHVRTMVAGFIPVHSLKRDLDRARL